MAEHKPMKVPVTGNVGFVGSSFVRYMLKNDTHVRIVNLDALLVSTRE